MVQDILVEIPDEDLPKLADMYLDKKETIPHAYTHIRLGIDWRKKGLTDYIKFFSPNNCWKEDGTVLSISKFWCYNVQTFSTDYDGNNIYKALKDTNIIKFPTETNPNPVTFFALQSTFYDIVVKALTDRNLSFAVSDIPAWTMFFKKEDAETSNLSIPSDLYLKQIDKSHIPQINEVWPHKCEGSENYIWTMMEANGGYGLFLKSNSELVTWGTITILGQIGVLQTKDNHKRKGYAAMMILHLSKEMARKGLDTYATIVVGNVGSRNLFEKVGFKCVGESSCRTILPK